MLLPALSVLTGCRTAAAADTGAAGVIIRELSELPALPAWPDVTWTYEGGKYCLDEADADRVLDYLENRIPAYEFKMELYAGKVRAVRDGILAL